MSAEVLLEVSVDKFVVRVLILPSLVVIRDSWSSRVPKIPEACVLPEAWLPIVVFIVLISPRILVSSDALVLCSVERSDSNDVIRVP